MHLSVSSTLLAAYQLLQPLEHAASARLTRELGGSVPSLHLKQPTLDKPQNVVGIAFKPAFLCYNVTLAVVNNVNVHQRQGMKFEPFLILIILQIMHCLQRINSVKCL